MNWLGDHNLPWFPGIDRGLNRLVLVVSKDRQIAVDQLDSPLFLESSDSRLHGAQQVLIGSLNDTTFFAVQVGEPNVFKFQSLRSVLLVIPSELFIPVNAAIQLLDFVTDHRFCGSCGAETNVSFSDRGLKCGACNFVQYPRISPCIIVLVTRGSDILLARAPRFVDGMYSTLAGFIEAGESAEHACHREVFEEVGVQIERPIYQGSQSWPFKHSLMLGYRAKWKAGDINIDGDEIVDANWFTVENLPKLPPKASISRGLIEAFVDECVS